MKSKLIEELLTHRDISVVKHFETFDAELSKSQWSEKYVLKLRITVGNRLPNNAIENARFELGLEGAAIEAAPLIWHFTK